MASKQIASAVRSASFNDADNTKAGAGIRGVKIVFDITSAPGTDTVQLTLQGKDPVSGKYYTLLQGAAEVAAATRIYTLYPGLTAAANAVASDVLPDTYRVTVTHSAGSNFTYSVGVNELG